MKRVLTLLVTVVVSAAGLLTAVTCLHRKSTYPHAPVVLISIDTLRADHLPLYGYTKVSTPAIDALAAHSVVYESAYSHVPLTFPSHTTVMTGLLPFQSGVRDNIGYILSPDHMTLAAALKNNGYATGAAVSAIVLARATGIDQGFDFYDDNISSNTGLANLGLVRRSGFATEKILEEWIAKNDSKSFFAFLHLYEPHSPYVPAPEFAEAYKTHPYDGCIATADEIAGRFLDFLKSRKDYDPAIVILMSDHGEGLGEHGEDEHGLLIYRDTLHVPLIIKLPGNRQGGTRVAAPVGLFDIFPTVLKLLEIAAPPGRDGVALLPAIAPDARNRDIYSETYYPRYHFGWSELAGLTASRYQYIHSSVERLFDILKDPGELTNLAPGLPAPFRQMRNALLTMNRPETAPGAASAEQLKKLAALGYLGTISAPAGATHLPDPESHIGELHRLLTAARLKTEKKYPEAKAELESLLKTDPKMLDAWTQLADVYHQEGNYPGAIASWLAADRLQPGSPNILASLADEYFEAGDWKNARLYAERSLAVNGPEEAHLVLAKLDLRNKDYAGAQKEAQQATTGYWKSQVSFLLARIAKARGDYRGALKILDGLATEGPQREVEFQRGDILARLGENAQAEGAFQAEIQHFPDDYAAWNSLAFLYASEGKSELARQTLEKLIRNDSSAVARRAAARAYRIMGDPAAAQRVLQGATG